MADPFFDPPDADDTIRRPLPQARQSKRPNGESLFFDDGFDDRGDDTFRSDFAAPRPRRADSFDDLLGDDGGFPDDFGTDP
jgi:hypothetical protein